MSEQSQALTVIQRAQVALQPAANDLQLAELAAASKSITAITNPAGYQQAHSARMALKNQRVAIEKIAKSAREDATAFSKAVIAEEKRLIGLIQPEEERLESLQSEWDAARAAEKRAKEEAERARVQEIQRRLAKLQALPEIYTSALAPEKLSEVVAQLETGLTFDYQEFAEQAEASRQAAIVALRQAHADAVERIEREDAERAAREAEEARKAAERKAEEERLAEVRRRLDEERAEQERQAALRRAEEEKQRQEQTRIDEIRRWIVALNGPTHLTASDSPTLIEQEIGKLEDSRIDDRYGEFVSEAAAARARGIARLTELCNAAHARQAEQRRLAEEQARLDAERREFECQQRDQAERQAEIERREREQHEAEERQRRETAEAEERRLQAEREEHERQEAQAARQREIEKRRAAQRQRIGALSAAEIIDLVAAGLLFDDGGAPDQDRLIAARIAAIPRKEWNAIAKPADRQEEAAA